MKSYIRYGDSVDYYRGPDNYRIMVFKDGTPYPKGKSYSYSNNWDTYLLLHGGNIFLRESKYDFPYRYS